MEINANVGPDAYARLTSTSATRLYRSHPETLPARQVAQIQVAKNSLLEYVPDPLIPFAGARYQQQTQIQLNVGDPYGKLDSNFINCARSEKFF